MREDLTGTSFIWVLASAIGPAGGVIVVSVLAYLILNWLSVLPSFTSILK